MLAGHTIKISLSTAKVEKCADAVDRKLSTYLSPCWSKQQLAKVGAFFETQYRTLIGITLMHTLPKLVIAYQPQMTIYRKTASNDVSKIGVCR